MTRLLSTETPTPGVGTKTDNSISRRLKCPHGYQLTVVHLEGKGVISIPCKETRCKLGGVFPVHVFALETGELLGSVWQDAGMPREILDQNILNIAISRDT